MNVSSYGGDIMGVQTPNIDRIGREGLRLTSFYAQPSCTAGRAAFITGQLPVRTGLTTVGTPGSPAGLQKEDITLAEILKTRGYSTAQFGKNHLGDLEENSCRNITASTSSLAISTTSMPTRIWKTRIGRSPQSFARSSIHAASFRGPPMARQKMRVR
jgi:arylsulfatase A-like enzyme